MKNELIGYRPRLKVRFRPEKKIKYWWVYYLPFGNSVKRVWRPFCNDQALAKRHGKLKEEALLRHEFDSWDKKRMGLNHLSRLTIQEATKLYLDKGMANYSFKGKESVGPTVRKLFDYFETNCNKRYLDEINADDFHQLREMLKVSGMLGRPVKNLTINRYQKWLKTAFYWFVKNRLMNDNPLVSVVPIRLAKSEKARKVVIPLNDWLQIIKAPTPKGFAFDIKPIVLFATATGLRKDELIHLQWSDFDWTTDQIKIKVKNDCPTKNGLTWRPKWNVEGDVPLNNIAKLVLDSIEKHDEVFGSCKVGDKTVQISSDFVFSRLIGDRQVRIDTFRRAWSQLLRNAGMTGKYKFKDLRSTSNSYFKIYCQMNPDEASKVLRNTPEVNLAHYSGTIPSELNRKMNQLPPEMEEAAKRVLSTEIRVIH